MKVTTGETDGVLADVTTFESLLKVVGTNGRWNIMLFVLCAACAFISPLQTLTYQFVGATPDYWCHIDPLVQANWTDEEIISFAIPRNNDTGKTESCMMYDFDFTQISHLGYNKSISFSHDLISRPKIPCSNRDFNKSVYESTVAIEWDLVCERRVLYSTTQAAAQAGKFVGYFFMGYLLDTYGRRPVILITGVLTLASGLLSAASLNVGFYIFLKIIINIMTSGVYLGGFVLAMETCSKEQRSMVGVLFVIPWALGYMVIPGIAYIIKTWKWLEVAYASPAIFLISYFWILPESPRWLILKGKHQEALKILKIAAKMNKQPMPSDKAILQAMERIGKIEIEKSESDMEVGLLTRAKAVVYQYLALIRIKEIRTRTMVVFFCWCAASMVYYGVALNATNLSADPYIYVFLGGALELPSYLLLWPAIVYIGRTISLAALYFICGISIFAVMFLLLFLPTVHVGVTMFLSLCGKMAITAAFHLIWMFTAELFPTEYRSLAVGLAGVIARVGSLCSPYINDILGELVVWAPSALFGIVSLIAGGLSFFLPDTKGRDLPETNEFETNLSEVKTKPSIMFISYKQKGADSSS